MENTVRKGEHSLTADKDALRAKVKELMDVSTIPAVLNKILELTGNPNTVNHDLANVIERDQAIAMRVVAASNSAFYGFSKKINTISQAILVLGFDMVRGLAITTSVFRSVPAEHASALKELWAHSFRTAQAATLLAKETGTVERESAFLAGLFHDIGRAILLQISEKGCAELSPFARNPLEKEEHVFGATHAEAGSWLAERFNLPENCVRAIRYHHEPERCPQPAPPHVLITYLANLLASEGPNAIASPEHARIISTLKLEQTQLERIVSEITRYDESSSSFYE